MPSGVDPNQHGQRHVSQPDAFLNPQFASSYDPSTGQRSPSYGNTATQWLPPPNLGPGRLGAPAMLRHASEGGLTLPRSSRRHTPYGPSPTASTFAAAGQEQPVHQSRRRQSNASNRPSSSRMPDQPNLGLGPAQIPKSYDYGRPGSAQYDGHDGPVMQYNGSLQQGQQYSDMPGATYLRGPPFGDPGLDDMSTANTSPMASPLNGSFPRSPMESFGAASSNWPHPQQPFEAPRPNTAGAALLDGAHGLVMQRNRSAWGYTQYPNSLPAQNDSSRTLGADLVVGIGGTGPAGGVAMSHSMSQPGPMRDMGAYPGVSDVVLPAGQHFEWPVKTEAASTQEQSYDLMAQYGGPFGQN